MGGIQLAESVVDVRGLQFDRRYMLVTPSGRFLSQRQSPQMAHFQLSFNFEKTGFLVRFQGDTLEIPLALIDGQCSTIEAQVWDDFMRVLVADTAINDWFSARLQQPVLLVYLPDTSLRVSKEGEQEMSLADGYPILVISEASLTQLNDRIAENSAVPETIEMLRFRPNIVLKNLPPHAEDTLDNFHLGDVRFQVIKPCSRCVLTTINPITLARSNEPLQTLSTYRKKNNKILFGANVACLEPGKIRIHD